ncbi:MAG: dockerin type I repeat-containing protein [Clostridia bacterium]|nr:dockerin type I repeat-containing protein [Clostridia bacterium]
MKKILSLIISLSIILSCCCFYTSTVWAEGAFDSFTSTDALWHLGVAGATSSTTNYNDMNYVCQPFVPSNSQMTGAKIGLNLTTLNATLHIEVATTPGGTPLASGDTSINSKGNGFNWYTANLDRELTLTAGQRYYMTVYLASRTNASVCVIHGGSISDTNNSARLWQVASGTTPQFDTATGMAIAFQIVSPINEAIFESFDATDALWHLGVKGVDSSFPNYAEMNFVCQPFVPSSNQMVGAKIGLNLTTLNATLHIEISTTPGGTPLASGNTAITSKGNGFNWYNAYLDQKLIVNPAHRYYMTVYLSSRSHGSVCVIHGGSVSDTNNSALLWQVSSGTQVKYTTPTGAAIAFQIVGSAAFTECNGTTSLYHLSVSGATSDSYTNYNEMRYVSQPFVPETADMYGASVSLLLTTGTATLRIEVSATPGGTPIASGESSITSVGNRAAYYTVYFNNKATLTPYSTYYLTCYFTKCPTYAIGIVCGNDVGTNNATHPTYIKAMNGSSFSSGSNNVIIGFKILTHSKDIFMIYDGENLNGVRSAYNTDISLSNLSTEGGTGLRLDFSSPKGQSANVGGMVSIADGPLNLTGYDTVMFDLFVEKTISGTHHLQINFATTGEDGFNTTINISNTQAGWHTYKLKTASIPEDVDADWSNINNLRFTWFNHSQISTTTCFVIDNVYMTNAIEYGDIDKNGRKDASDALQALKTSVGSVSLSAEQKTLADVSGEGNITAWDAMLILKYSVGASKSFPVEKPEFTDPTYGFKDTISQEVLCNYLARSVTISQNGVSLDKTSYITDFILNTGAKYVSRMACVWLPSVNDYNTYNEQKAFIDDLHSKDPFVVLEACVFETTWTGVETIPIPAYVFEAFGLPVETRNFSYSAMCFPDGTGVNHWANDQSLPDITQIETQMFFYYRSCEYIKIGYEALHMGQVMQTGAHDVDFACWTNLIAKIRAFAKDNARRGMVIINGHTHGILGNDGVLLFDFHSYPARLVADGTVKRGPTESNPQKAYFVEGHGDSIYGNSLGGVTYSGWKCDSLPYYVEIDNWGNDASIIHDPTKDANGVTIWGMDEISWFCSQPKSYREEFLRYAYDWVKNKTSGDGFFCMPGERTANKYDVNGNIIDRWYYSYDSRNHSKGLDDEAVIKAIWNG